MQVALGYMVATRPNAWMLAAGVTAVTCMFAAPRLAAPVVVAASFAYVRAGPSSLNVSFADLTLVLSVVALLPYISSFNAPTKRAYQALVAYLLVIGVAVAATPTQRAFIELAHRSVLVGGSIAVGLALSNIGARQRALRCFVLVAAVFSLGALLDLASNPVVNGVPAPAYPFGMQKNPAAALISIAILVLLVAPDEVRLPRLTRLNALGLLFAGMLACQSRGAALALTLILLANAFRQKRLHASAAAILGCAALLTMVVVSFNVLLHSDQRDSRFNTVNSRITTYDAALDLWKDEPFTGAGIRFFRDPNVVSSGEPHNLLVATLGETGLVGIAATLILFGSALAIARRIEGELGALALWALSMKLLSSTVDIFWVAGTMTVPWIVLGLALADHQRRSEPVPGRDLIRKTVASGTRAG